MAIVTVEILVGAVVAPEGTFTIPYPSGTVQADYNTPQDVIFDQAGVETTASAAFGASVITITWPALAAGDLQPGTYFIDLDTTAGGPIPNTAVQVGYLANSAAVDVAGIVASHNALLAALQASGLMKSA